MKTRVLVSAIAVMAGLFFTSCEKEEAITISILELGMGDDHATYTGGGLHIEADILAEAKIDKISVELHKEGGAGEEIEAEFDEFSGQKNVSPFHEHIDIPATAETGEYHFHLTVTDMEGNAKTVEEHVNIKAAR